jgi:hypothetical protein
MNTVAPVLAAFLGELESLKITFAVESLTQIPPENRTEFGYGLAAGRLEGIAMARTLLDKVLDDQRKAERLDEDKERGTSGRSKR